MPDTSKDLRILSISWKLLSGDYEVGPNHGRAAPESKVDQSDWG